ncbi:MAG: hypothetical protein KAH09_07600 [Desulfobacula sp.]|nr:hypothetical protein [Desulfobacula sp.]
MEPNKFRESRQAINRLCENIIVLIEQNALEASKEGHQEVSSQLDLLRPHAEGEIQKRSVKNLGMKINGLLTRIGKLKPKKKPAKKDGKSGAKTGITWNEERVGQLSTVFLQKLFTNMGDDTNAKVCFGTTGKGIRPNYQIEFSNQEITVFTGSGHKPLDKPLSAGTKKISQPFPQDLIGSILRGK